MSDPADRLLGMSVDELLRDYIATGADPDSVYGSQQRLVANARMLDALRASIDAAAAGTERLQRRIFWLTLAIAAGTVVGALATAWGVWG